MPSLPLYDLSKKKVGNIDLSDLVFAGEVKPTLFNYAVRGQIAKRYENKTANAKTRTEVQGSGKKIYRQKGTGQARHGDIKAPIFVGGGKAHGPKPHQRTHKVNKKVRKAALVGAISMHQKEDRLFVVDKMEVDKPSTKTIANALKAFGITKALIVNVADGEKAQAFNQSARNVPNVKFLRPEGVNVFDLLKYRHVLISSKAAQKLTERFSDA